MSYFTDDAHSVYFYFRAIYKQKYISELTMSKLKNKNCNKNKKKLKKQTQNNESLP